METTEKKEVALIDKLKAAHESAETKRQELSDKLKCKVKFRIFYIKDAEPCICFFRSAPTITKMRCRDLIYQGMASTAADMLLQATLIKEESDSRVLRQDNDDDEYYMAALDYCEKQFTQARAYEKKN